MQVIATVVEMHTLSSYPLQKFVRTFEQMGFDGHIDDADTTSSSLDEPPQKLEKYHLAVNYLRFLQAFRMMRIMWCSTANKYLQLLIQRPNLSKAEKTHWINLQKAFEQSARTEADLVIATIPFYFPPGQAQVSPSSVVTLIWPLATFSASEQLTLAQKTCAQKALLQIGEKANIPIAIELANAFNKPVSELPKEAHLVHLTWQT
jgi:hypothetical protein